jgi:hypothetical protein
MFRGTVSLIAVSGLVSSKDKLLVEPLPEPAMCLLGVHAISESNKGTAPDLYEC